MDKKAITEKFMKQYNELMSTGNFSKEEVETLIQNRMKKYMAEEYKREQEELLKKKEEPKKEENTPDKMIEKWFDSNKKEHEQAVAKPRNLLLEDWANSWKEWFGPENVTTESYKKDGWNVYTVKSNSNYPYFFCETRSFKS